MSKDNGLLSLSVTVSCCSYLFSSVSKFSFLPTSMCMKLVHTIYCCPPCVKWWCWVKVVVLGGSGGVGEVFMSEVVVLVK